MAPRSRVGKTLKLETRLFPSTGADAFAINTSPERMDMTQIVRFAAPESEDSAIVGGKAASLGRLTRGGFPVPDGFTVATTAQLQFFAAAGLDDKIAAILRGLDYRSATALESETRRIRELIVGAAMPRDLEQAIREAYRLLGDDVYVAVRSSGTAEDLAGASFAGLHDTYLDVRGVDRVLDAARRCLASMWTARAVVYREQGGFDHMAARIAVVVQRMIAAEVSGVLFTANPQSVRSDEFVVNASWGLGEGIVSGIVTPDEFILEASTLAIKKRTIGAKEKKVVRRSETAVGTETVPVEASLRDVSSLSETTVVALGELGRSVMAFHGGLPQDIEWAYAEGKLYLLQARPVTGVEFTWDEDVDAWHPTPENENTVWTHTWAEQFLTGGVTPLFSSLRSWECYSNWSRFAAIYGFDELTDVHWFKYRRATMYYNADAERIWQRSMWPPPLRDLTNVPPAWQDEFAKQPTSLVEIARMWLRLHTLEPKYGLFRWFDTTYSWIDHRIEEANGPTPEELRHLSDAALKLQIDRSVKLVDAFFATLWPGFFWIAGGAFGALNLILTHWYDGDYPGVFQDLITGIPDTALVREANALWHLSDEIHRSQRLITCMREHRDGAFFAALEDFEEGKAFLKKYHEFLRNHGHRGHQDRDIYYNRRVEDPGLDYRAFQALQAAGHERRPEEIERELVERRENATNAVVANLTTKSFGSFKAEVFKAVLRYTHRFLKFRDDERHFLDRQTLQKKRVFAELGRRMRERGLLRDEDDFYFLARHELFDLFEGRASQALCRAKIDARRTVFHRRNARQEHTPPYIQAGVPIDLDRKQGDVPVAAGALRGMGTSRGEATGRARVVRDLGEIGRIEKDDILVCNSTDPGWMPVFPLINGLVLETGGMLAHGACLSREYGLPAVQLRNAIQLIPDGAVITVNGDTGEICMSDAA
jgi:pyruvate,water dikinase